MNSKSMIAWLKTLAPDVYFHDEPGPYQREKPDRAMLVTRTGGNTDTNEGLIERVTFQVRVRGYPNDPFIAEKDAGILHDTIREQAWPQEIPDAGGGESFWVLGVTSPGGGPAPVPGTPDPGRRTEHQTNYLVISSTNL